MKFEEILIFLAKFKNCSVFKGYSIWIQAVFGFGNTFFIGNEKDVWFLWLGRPQTGSHTSCSPCDADVEETNRCEQSLPLNEANKWGF